MYLLTGYEPFGDHDTNPSATLAETFDGRRVAGHEVVGEVLPVVFADAADEMAALLDEHDPDAVVMSGLAGGRNGVCLERVAVNVDDAVTVPDNDDADPENERIDPDGPDARFATLPVGDCVEALLDEDIPARLSNTAGTHLCNHLTYTTLGALDARDSDAPAGFLHLPYTPPMAADKARENNAHRGGSVPPSLSIEHQRRAVETVFETL
ncbi:hypothetical protein [Natronomonas gomsonensis]|uniref:pyroglutamyl-peptidase I family protein n=1 Tax=Natronomonas gomsonensis TaxID=1046043 RepID=UPI0015B9D8BA|nr:hypothetical protein [Natronomonas gomsonensis]